MIRAPLLSVLLAAAPALAGPVCNFTEECYMTLDCEASDWQLTVDLGAGVLSTVAEDLDILHVEDGQNTQIVARGMGSLNLLTIGPATSVLTAHIAAGPAAITYYGECREE